MFAYALGSIAGGSAIAPGDGHAAVDRARVERIVDEVIVITESDEFEVSSARVLAAIRE